MSKEQKNEIYEWAGEFVRKLDSFHKSL